MRISLGTWFHRTSIAFIALSLFACGKAPTSTSGGSSFLNGNTTNNGNNATNNSNCQYPLQVALTLSNPTSGVINVNTPVTFKVRMQGCNNSFMVTGPSGLSLVGQSAFADSTNNFVAELAFTKTYSAIGVQRESVEVTPRMADGTLLPGAMKSISLDVGIGVTVTNASAPSCQIIKNNIIPGAGLAAPFTLIVTSTQGSVTSATLNNAPINPSQPYPISPSVTDGKYYAYGTVSGPGGMGLCQLVVTPPGCSMIANSVTNGSVAISMAFSGSVASANIESTPITLPAPPNNLISFNYPTMGSGPAVLTTNLVGPGGDKGSCLVTFSRCHETYVVNGSFNGNASPIRDVGPGGGNNIFVSGIWAGISGVAAMPVLSQIKGGDRIKFEQISGTYYWATGVASSCLAGLDYYSPYIVGVLQFADEARAVVRAPISTPLGRNAMLLRDLPGATMTVPEGATALFGSIADSYSGDNSGTCQIQMRVTPACQ